MKRRTHVRGAIIALGAAAVVFAGVGMAAEDDKVLICHGTVSEPNPYVLISVDSSALAGHFDGTAPGHGPYNNPDFIDTDGDGDCSTNGNE